MSKFEDLEVGMQITGIGDRGVGEDEYYDNYEVMTVTDDYAVMNCCESGEDYFRLLLLNESFLIGTHAMEFFAPDYRLELDVAWDKCEERRLAMVEMCEIMERVLVASKGYSVSQDFTSAILRMDEIRNKYH